MTMTWLARLHPETSWAHLATTDFPAYAAYPGALAVLPVHGCTDHGMGLSLDAEEAVASRVLTEACGQTVTSCAPCVLPPLRFGPAPYPTCTWFGLPLEIAQRVVKEIAAGVRFAGFARLLIVSSNPWHKEWLDAVAVDIRIETGLTVYRIHLGALGLDFHPAAPQAQRLALQAAASIVLGTEPIASNRQISADEEFRPGKWSQPPPLPAGPLDPLRQAEGDRLLTSSAERLARLLSEAAWNGRPPAAHFRPVPVSAKVVYDPAPLWRPYGPRALVSSIPAAMRAAANRPGALVIIPTAAIEQHGPHLAVGADAIIGQGLLARALDFLPASCPVCLAPPLLVGKSTEHADFPGTLSLSATTFAAMVRAQVEQLARLGFQRIAIWNTHGGNSAVLVPLIRELQATPGLRIGMLQHGYKPHQSPQEAAYGFHAGEWETALMLALAPSLVRRARAICHYPAQLDDAGELRPVGAALTFGWSTRDIAPNGVMGDATLATTDQGAAWVEATAQSLAERIASLTRT
jgi:creatinine amidohydrolase